MRSALAALAVSLVACSPDRITPNGVKSRDLGGFILPSETPDGAVKLDAAVPKDFSTGPAPDFASPPSSTCGMVTYAGYCTGSEVTWCESGSLETYDCANDGKACTVVMGDADCR
jgi:hypothetical protein